jgi:hypothetical protein
LGAREVRLSYWTSAAVVGVLSDVFEGPVWQRWILLDGDEMRNGQYLGFKMRARVDQGYLAVGPMELRGR